MSLDIARKNLESIFAFYAPTMKDVLPAHINARMITRYVITEWMRDSRLQACTSNSLVLSSIQACQMGLEPGNTLGYGYFVAFGKTAVFIPGYMGYIKLGRQHRDITDWQLRAVYSGDKFSIHYGSEPKIIHEPCIQPGKKGDLIGAYSIVWLKNGRENFTYMDRDEIEKRKKFSKSAGSDKENINMWRDFEDEAFKKTVVRNHAKSLPRSAHIDRMINYENALERAKEPKVIMNDGEITVVDAAPFHEESGDDVAKKLKEKIDKSGDNNQAMSKSENISAPHKVPDSPDRRKVFMAEWLDQQDDVLQQKYDEALKSAGGRSGAGINLYAKNMGLAGLPAEFPSLLARNRKTAVDYLYWIINKS